jgi:hypothetical protein
MGLLRRVTGRRADPAPVGLWGRAYADCASIARRRPELDDLLPLVRAITDDAAARWPTDSLDTPADPSARAVQRRLADVRRAFADAEYRAGLLRVDPDDAAQLQRFHAALATARQLLAD